MERYWLLRAVGVVVVFWTAFVLFSSCGKQAFVVSHTQVEVPPAGAFIVPPKVDLLLVEDDSGSIFEAYAELSQQIPIFLNQLESKNWDYHFATVPLLTDRPLKQILASKYDSNWQDLWIAPYPAAPRNGPGTVLPAFFSFPESYIGFISYASLGVEQNGSEPGFKNLDKAFSSRIPPTGFIREDALMVVLIVGNGEDTSNVNFCERTGGDKIKVPCEQTGRPLCDKIENDKTLIFKDGEIIEDTTCGSYQLSFDQYYQNFQQIKPEREQLKFYAAVANQRSTSCLGGNAYLGARYQQMAQLLGGEHYDICSQSIATILSLLSKHLQSYRILFQTHYLFLASEPDIASIQVIRHPGGDPSLSEVIPQNEDDGWTYAGYLSNAPMIDIPLELNFGTGYAIELHGSGRLMGDDTASIQFKPKGVQNSAK